MHTFQLGKTAQEHGFRLDAYDTVGSTNTEASQAAQQGDGGNHWFAALQQTEGRGRRGRVWESPHGNLAASLLLTPDADPAKIASLGFVAGVALHMALENILPRSAMDPANVNRIALKWPNDAIAGNAKLVGISLEALTSRRGYQPVVIGIGVNVVATPPGLPYPVTSLHDLGYDISAQDVFAALSDSWVTAYAVWNNGNGLEDILSLWRAAAAGIGGEVAVQTHNDIVRGVFERIDTDGRMIVRTNNGTQMPISAGDVHFGTVATVRDDAKEV